MAIKVQWDTDGPFAICDTAAEAMELMKQARSSIKGPTGPLRKSEPQTMDDKMSAVFSGINEKARKLLKALLNYPSGVEADEFGKVCGTEPAGFGGVLGAISKQAKKVDLTLDKLVLSEARFEGTRRYRWLTPAKLLIEYKGKLK